MEEEMKTDIYDIIEQYHGDKPYEPDSVKDDYKEFKDYTYDVKMSLKDINYLLDILDAYGNLANGAYCAKARFWKILLDSDVHLEEREKPIRRMFARPPFGCVKNIYKGDCETHKSKGCDICEFNCIEELELSGKSAYANPNFVGFEEIVKEDMK